VHGTCRFVRGHNGQSKTTQSNEVSKESFIMKTTKTSVKRAALIAVLVLGSSAWLSAQTYQGRIAPPGSGLDRQQNWYGTNSQYNQGRSGQAEAGLGSQQDNYAITLGTNAQSSQPLKINKGSSLIGTTVKNQQGETLGKVSDLVIDFSTERVTYVVLDSAPGVLTAQKLHAVPLRAFQPDAEGTSLILNAEKAKLDRAPGFAKDNWPVVAAPAWGAEPFWKNTQGTHDSPEQRALDQHYMHDNLNKDSQTTTKQPKAEPQSRP